MNACRRTMDRSLGRTAADANRRYRYRRRRRRRTERYYTWRFSFQGETHAAFPRVR